MKKLFLIFFLISSFLNAEIVEIKNFSEIYSYVNPNTLIILDIDDTLLIPVQMLGCDEWFLSRLKYYKNQGWTSSNGFEKTLAEWEAIRHLTQMEIVEPGTEKIVKKLQDEGYTVMCLTTQGLALATRTKIQLNENHIDLLATTPSKEDHYLNNDGHGVLFRNGILFTSGSHKGKALFALFDRLNYMPESILFINDKASHLQSIEETAEQRGVEFIGLRYAYSDVRKAAYDEQIADYQFNHSSFSHLLSDDEAKIALEISVH